MGIRPLTSAPDWSARHHRGKAKCRDAQWLPSRDDGDVFFDAEGEALAVCNGTRDGEVCPRRRECLLVAMINKEGYGVWGGMTPRDRLALRLRYPGAPERWTWHPPRTPPPEKEILLWQVAS